MAPNGTVPAPSPDDKFSKLWETTSSSDDMNAPIFEGMDPGKLQEAAGKVNFAQVIGRDTLGKIAAGGEDAATAFMESMNKVAQTVYAQNALVTTQIVEKALAQQQARFAQTLPNMLKRHAVSDGLRSENPLLSRPEVAPIVGALETQLTSQYPNATATEIKQMAKEYLTQFAKAVAPNSRSDELPSGRKQRDDDVDWDEWMNS
jgi:hypothetical protein